MTESAPAYGLWFLVVLNSAIFILFAFSFFKPKTGPPSAHSALSWWHCSRRCTVSR